MTPVEQRRLERIARERDEAMAELKMYRIADQTEEIHRLRGKLDVANAVLAYFKKHAPCALKAGGCQMTTLHSLLAECECWLGVEPTDEAQVAEVAELRERVRQALSPSCRECMGTGVVTRGIGLVGAVGVGHCDCVPAEKRTPENEPFVRLAEPLATTAASFLSDVAAKRNADGLE